MREISILDCTLRDGGYVNQWKFGYSEKCDITSSVVRAGIEIVECGFLKESDKKFDDELTLYNDIEKMSKTLPKDMQNTIAVCMINFGEYNLDRLPEYNGIGVSGIRIAFHKDNAKSAIEDAYKIKQKGYKVFLQPMVSLNYSDAEFIDLIKECNKLQPYAFYIVDSFGMMQRKDVVRLFYIVDNNIEQGIKIGFHAHNNLQMALLNAQALIDIQSKNDLIIDSSILGMGRGAGNLNTELLTHFLNENYNKSYVIQQLLYVIDSVVNDIYIEKYWGYSIPNYISAIHSSHPNYATYLDEKKTMTVDDMNSLFMLFTSDKRKEFDKNYVEKLYVDYMLSKRDNKELDNKQLTQSIRGKDVLIIAAGKSILTHKKEILKYINNPSIISISVNFEYENNATDYIFIGNRRRFDELQDVKPERLILTSNVNVDIDCYKVAYSELINSNEIVCDNSGLMLIKLLIDLGANKIYVAGMDGYGHNSNDNFAIRRMKTHMSNEYVDMMNAGMKEILDDFKAKIDIHFITETIL